ncbi:hypothetical protein AB1L88_05055 [Tautonia sp. JC769]|uniref:hypothetical protein n=1 Tax=Tautonia sp. JC769 TaxID=3232135 RepID=UPI00345AA467
MAAKKTATKKKTSAAPAKAKAAAARPATARKAAAPKASKTSTKATAAAPSATSTKATPAKSKPASKPATKKPLKLTDAQEKILRQIDSVGDAGYVPAQKTELRSIDKLRELKLVKKGAKDKETGAIPFLTTAAGKKHLAASTPA